MKSKGKAYNWTTRFALPLLGWRRSMFEPYLINTYIKHEGLEHFQKNHLFVLLKEGLDERYKTLDKTLVESRTHVSQYYIDEEEIYVMHIFELVPEVIPDYELFLKGKYSHMSDAAKGLIKNTGASKAVMQVLNRDKAMATYQENRTGVKLKKDEEVWSKITDPVNIKNEIFTDDLFKTIQESE